MALEYLVFTSAHSASGPFFIFQLGGELPHYSSLTTTNGLVSHSELILSLGYNFFCFFLVFPFPLEN